MRFQSYIVVVVFHITKYLKRVLVFKVSNVVVLFFPSTLYDDSSHSIIRSASSNNDFKLTHNYFVKQTIFNKLRLNFD